MLAGLSTKSVNRRSRKRLILRVGNKMKLSYQFRERFSTIFLIACCVGIGIVLPIGLTVKSYTDVESSKNLLLSQGYSEVVYEGYDWLNCGRGDIYRHRFSVLGKGSQRAEKVLVCSSFFGGSTVRTFR
jgi:hypothetical protein